jgi:hypothetical protein
MQHGRPGHGGANGYGWAVNNSGLVVGTTQNTTPRDRATTWTSGLATDLGTHATSTALTNRRGRLDKDSPRKIATALTLFAEHVDGEELMSGLEVSRTSVVTRNVFAISLGHVSSLRGDAEIRRMRDFPS